MLRALWEYRALVASLVQRDFRLRSARALWGNAWLAIHAAAQILIYTVIFSEVMQARLPGAGDRLSYGLYVCVGLITWSYFSEILVRSQTLFLQHADLLKTLRFPRATLPAALFVGATLNFAVVAGIFLVVLLATDRWPGIALLGAVPLLAIQGLLALALGVLTGTVNVFFRDVGNAMSVLLQFWFWLTPIVYPIGIVPEPVRSWLALNPLFPIVSGYQSIVLEQTLPDWAGAALALAVGLVLAGAAWSVFRALSPDLVEEL
jgi:lipopolysaccharide transport system permease protein